MERKLRDILSRSKHPAYLKDIADKMSLPGKDRWKLGDIVDKLINSKELIHVPEPSGKKNPRGRMVQLASSQG